MLRHDRSHWHQQVPDSTPGCFEGEPDWTPYYWDQVLDGFSDRTVYSDDDGEDATVEYDEFDVDDEARGLFPELVDAKCVRVGQTESGFIWSEVIR